MFGLRAHVDPEAVPHHDDPEWQMAGHTVIHWLDATISPDLLEAIMQPEDTAHTVWLAVDELFRNNQMARAVYVDAEYHATVQGDMTVMQFCTKLKTFADQLRDLGQPVTDPRQVFHLLRGLNRQYHSVIPHITCQNPLPTFLQVRSFLLLEEHRAEQAARQQSTHALYAGRASPASSAPSTLGSRTNTVNPNALRAQRESLALLIHVDACPLHVHVSFLSLPAHTLHIRNMHADFIFPLPSN